MKKLLLISLFLASPAFAGQTTAPGNSGQFIYNNAGNWAAGTFGSGLNFSGGTLTTSIFPANTTATGSQFFTAYNS